MSKAGCILGLAWGDVFGCPVEGWSEADIRSVYGDYAELPMTNAILNRRSRPIGLHSDDTQQALALINVVLGGWSVELWGHWLAEGARRGVWRGTGRNFDTAVQKLVQGVPPLSCGTPSGGIGAAMRIAPLGALGVDEVIVRQASRVTHADEPAIEVAVNVAKVARGFVDGLPLEAIRAGVSIPLVPQARPNRGFALAGGLHALVRALRPDVDPAVTLSDIVRYGDDTDTVAAICGALLGARCGTAWIPVHRLLDRTRLERYADALENPHGPVETLDEFLAAEAEWTRQEQDLQRTRPN